MMGWRVLTMLTALIWATGHCSWCLNHQCLRENCWKFVVVDFNTESIKYNTSWLSTTAFLTCPLHNRWAGVAVSLHSQYCFNTLDIYYNHISAPSLSDVRLKMKGNGPQMSSHPGVCTPYGLSLVVGFWIKMKLDTEGINNMTASQCVPLLKEQYSQFILHELKVDVILEEVIPDRHYSVQHLVHISRGINIVPYLHPWSYSDICDKSSCVVMGVY